MFFQGTLQQGISTALQHNKQVVCFVTDEEDESQQWEDEFLAEDLLKGPLESQAVTLRLKAGSEETGYLEALFPVPRKPTIVVIKNGQLIEYIAGGISKNEFIRRLGLALGVSSSQTPAPASASASPVPQSVVQSQQTTPAGPPQPTAEDDECNLHSDTPSSRTTAPRSPQPPAQSSSATSPSTSSQSARVQAFLAERAKRVEADKKAKEKAEREARAKERADAADGTGASNSNISKAESSYAQMVRKRKVEEKEERQRILKRIEDDRRERKEREAQERQARLLLNAMQDEDPPESKSSMAKGKGVERPIHLTNRNGGTHCNIQIRLFDGSTIRARFPSDQTLGKEVRQWIDENRTDGDAPYTFRVVLTPLPNKAIEPSEEGQTLLELGLAPSSTLVLVPMFRAVSAFRHGGGFFMRGWAYVYAMFIMLFGFPAMLFRGRQTTPREGDQEEIPLENLDRRGVARQRIQGFQNPDDSRRDQQLYNGNSLNFEPRRDRDEEDD